MKKTQNTAKHALDYYIALKSEVDTRDLPRNKFFNTIDKIDRVEYTLPTNMEMQPWTHKVVSPEGRDAIRTATRALSGVFPHIEWMPVSDREEDKKEANKNERICELLFKEASDRNEVPIQRDVVKSAFKYDMAAVEVIYVPYQKRIAKKLGIGGDADKWEAAERYGKFVVRIRDPRCVHIIRSDYGMEAVLYVVKQPLHKIIANWGPEKFSELIDKKDPGSMFATYTICDYVDHFDRVIWVEGGKKEIEIMRMPHGLPFMGTWVVRSGGTNMDDDSQYMYEPLLASMVHSGQWETINILETLLVSDELARAYKPHGIAKGPNADKIEVDYTTPDQKIIVDSSQDYKPIPPDPIDTAKLQVLERMHDTMRTGSVARVLQDAQMPSNTAFSAINSVLGVASTMLRPHKMLSEQVLSDIIKRMVEWIHYVGDSVAVVGDGKEVSIDSSDYGMEYVLDPQFFDPKDVRIKVELETDMPMDKQQKINASAAANTTLQYPVEDALKDIGVNDPRMAMRKWAMEQMSNTILEAEKTKIMADAQAYAQKVIAMAQAEVQQAQMAQQQAMAAQQQGAMQTTDFNRVGNNTGDMNNPGIGGLPPAMSDQTQTFEQQSGLSRAGQEINNVG